MLFTSVMYLKVQTLLYLFVIGNGNVEVLGLSLTSIFFDSIIDILFFDSDYFDSILKNCTNRIFSRVPHYF